MISIILPVLNEVRHGYLDRLLASIRQQKEAYELIVVDSESTDDTIALCQPHADQLIQAGACNRAMRMNKGAEVAQGEVLLFHHPRSILPEEGLQALLKSLEDASVAGGGFRHQFDQTGHPLLWYTSWYNNAIQPKKGVMYLDHCLFVRREVFDDIGGFPNWDIFEDTKFPQEVARRGKLILLEESITTSSTRYRERGVFRQMATNQILKMGYHMGISPNRLNHWYEGKKPFNVSQTH